MATVLKWNTSDGINIYAKSWAIDNPKGVIALVHGLGEHINRYDHLAAFFNEKGYAVIGFDHRGHGQSEGKRGFTPNVDAMLDDIGLLLKNVDEKYAGVPVYLYGHSMGGNLVLNYVLRRKHGVAGAIVTGPWILLAMKTAKVKIFMGKLMRNIYPGFTESNGLDVKHISTDASEVKKYAEDPLVHDKVTASLGIGLMESGEWLNEYAKDTPIPLLLMHGGGDQITSPAASENFAKRVGGDVTFKKWDGFYHEIHNEKEQGDVFEFTLQWLKKLD